MHEFFIWHNLCALSLNKFVNIRVSRQLDRQIEKTRLQKWQNTILALSILFLLIALWLMVFDDLGQYRRIKLADITIANVTHQLYKNTIPIRGQVIPLETFYLTATEGGRVERLHVEDGQILSKGQALMDLSNPSLQLRSIESEAQVGQQMTALQQQELSLLQADLRDQQELIRIKSDIEIIEAKLNRLNKINKDFISAQEIETQTINLRSKQLDYQLVQDSYNINKISYRSQIEKIRDSISYLEENLKFTRANLRNLKIVSPIDGKLTAFAMEIGQSLNPGERIGQIDNPTQFKLVAEIQEFYQPQLNSGQTASLSFDGKDYRLIVKKIYPQIEEGHIKIDLVFESTQPANINRGQNLPLQLEIGKPEQAICIPHDSFVRETGGNWVFVVDKNNRAYKRFIKTGRQNGEFIEVLEGLEKSEKIIISSYAGFADELKLKIEN